MDERMTLRGGPGGAAKMKKSKEKNLLQENVSFA